MKSQQQPKPRYWNKRKCSSNFGAFKKTKGNISSYPWNLIILWSIYNLIADFHFVFTASDTNVDETFISLSSSSSSATTIGLTLTDETTINESLIAQQDFSLFSDSSTFAEDSTMENTFHVLSIFIVIVDRGLSFPHSIV